MALVEINKNPGKKELIVFGVGLPILAGLIGWRRWSAGAPLTAEIIWGIGAALTLAFAVVPPLRKRIYIGWMYLVFPIGWVVSHLILGGIYFIVFTPMSVMLKIAGKDPMNRKLDKSAKSYWVLREGPRDKASYFRQS